MQLPIGNNHLLWLMRCCGNNVWTICMRWLLYRYILHLMMMMVVVMVGAHQITGGQMNLLSVMHLIGFQLNCLMMCLLLLELQLIQWLFNDNRNSFDISLKFFVRVFDAFFKCMASTHLMNTLDTNFIGPSIGVVELFEKGKMVRRIVES